MGNPPVVTPNPTPISVPAPVAGPSAIPPITVFSAASQAASTVESDSDSDVKTLTIPFRSASGNFLPMITTEDKWISELEFRLLYNPLFLIYSVVIGSFGRVTPSPQ